MNTRQTRILTGSLRGTVFWLALPVLLEQFLSFLVGFYDTYLSGRIDSEATTAIGLAAYVGWLATMLFSLIGTGTTALVARVASAPMAQAATGMPQFNINADFSRIPAPMTPREAALSSEFQDLIRETFLQLENGGFRPSAG